MPAPALKSQTSKPPTAKPRASGSVKPSHQGAFMSTKQMISHARSGDSFVFRMPSDTLFGWLVGMDDYHYFVVVHEGLTDSISNPEVWPSQAMTESKTHLVLVHKTAPAIVFMDVNISQVPDEVQDVVARVGDPFLSYWEQQETMQQETMLQETMLLDSADLAQSS